MKAKRTWGIGISFFVLVISAYLLITASPLLTVALDKSDSLPLGTFITWAGIVSFPCFLFLITGDLYSPKDSLSKGFSKILKALIVLAVLWVPISALLAGNLSFTFSEKTQFQGGQMAMELFWYFNYFMVLAPLIVTLLYKLVAFILRIRIEN